MSLSPGTRLGSYELLAPLGAGGMGEVYRARDTKLNRDVAIKVLPESLAGDPERLARFTREAQTLASLNHSNIAHIHGLEESSDIRGLVMELVEGDDLSVRIARGPMPLADALPIARQIAEALDAAHEQGVVHRDLKPANIKVRPDGTVKVLDFGLAKAMDPSGAISSADAAMSPTFTARATQMGTIIGTAAYMAPEQARGKAVDKRADIWAFGVVLYEMLTGRRAFDGDDISDILAAVLRQDIDWAALPAGTPPRLRRLLERCLDRDAKQRLRDIGEARIEIAKIESGTPDTATGPLPAGVASGPTSTPGWRRALPWALVGALGAVLVAVLASGTGWRGRGPALGSVADGHFTIELPANAPLVTLEIPGTSEAPLAISPDGRHIVYVAPAGGSTRLYERAVADLTPRELAGTEGARLPFFSPDGQWVGFFADGKLKKVPLAGGTPATLAAAPDGCGAAWGAAGEIVFAPGETSRLFAVSEAGGTPRPVTTLEFADSHRWPQILPGGRAVLFTAFSWGRETADIVLVDLSTGTVRTVQEVVDFARWVPAAAGTAGGHLLFVRAGALMAAPFDPASTAPAGEPVVAVEGVRGAQFDVSATGVLVYTPGSSVAPDYSLVWVDRSGQTRPINDQMRGYEDLHLSPDGRQVALTIEEAGPQSPAHAWLADLARGTLTRFTFDGFSRDPVWTPDGKAIVFGSKRGESTFGLYRQRLDGQSSAELLWASPVPIWPDPQSITPDGRILVFNSRSKEGGDDIWTLSLDGDRAARPWLQTPVNEYAGRLSPDGRWMAYNSEESGTTEVYVQPFPGPGGKWLISQGGGRNAIWSRDGRELFYRHADQVVAVGVETTPAFAVGKPVVLFSGRYRLTGRDFDVSPDGSRFVMMRNDAARTTGRLNVLLNWWRSLETQRSGPPGPPGPGRR